MTDSTWCELASVGERWVGEHVQHTGGTADDSFDHFLEESATSYGTRVAAYD